MSLVCIKRTSPESRAHAGPLTMCERVYFVRVNCVVKANEEAKESRVFPHESTLCFLTLVIYFTLSGVVPKLLRQLRGDPLCVNVSKHICNRFGDCGLVGRVDNKVTWLILPVVICLSQRLSHACLSINNFIL